MIGEWVAMMNCEPLSHELVDPPQTREAVLGGQRGLGLVEQVEALSVESVDHHGEKRLAVRLLVQRDATVRRERVTGWLLGELFQIGRRGEEALSTQKEVGLRAPDAADQLDRRSESGVRVAR